MTYLWSSFLRKQKSRNYFYTFFKLRLRRVISVILSKAKSLKRNEETDSSFPLEWQRHGKSPKC